MSAMKEEENTRGQQAHSEQELQNKTGNTRITKIQTETILKTQKHKIHPSDRNIKKTANKKANT